MPGPARSAPKVRKRHDEPSGKTETGPTLKTNSAESDGRGSLWEIEKDALDEWLRRVKTLGKSVANTLKKSEGGNMGQPVLAQPGKRGLVKGGRSKSRDAQGFDQITRTVVQMSQRDIERENGCGSKPWWVKVKDSRYF